MKEIIRIAIASVLLATLAKSENEPLDTFLKTRPGYIKLEAAEVLRNFGVYHADTAHAMSENGRLVVVFSRNNVILGYSLKVADRKLTVSYDALVEAIKMAYPGYDMKSASGNEEIFEAMLLNPEAIAEAKKEHAASLVEMVRP